MHMQKLVFSVLADTIFNRLLVTPKYKTHPNSLLS